MHVIFTGNWNLHIIVKYYYERVFYFGEFSVTKNQFAISNETCHRVDFVEG